MTEPLAARIQSADPRVREAACREATNHPQPEAIGRVLAEALGDPVPAVARAASDALVAFARRAQAIPALLREALRTGAPPRRLGAALTLARLEPPGPALLPALVKALGWRDGKVRWGAARLLVNTGRLHGEVLPLLLGLVRTAADPGVRRMASFCLRELAPERPEAARVLLQATHDPEPSVRRAAFTALAALIDPPSEVLGRLLEALERERDAATRRIAALALAEVGASREGGLPDQALARLREAGRRPDDPDLREAAERALARLSAGGAR